MESASSQQQIMEFWQIKEGTTTHTYIHTLVMWLTRRDEHAKEMQNMILKWSTLYSLGHIVAVQTGRGANKRDGRNGLE